MTLIICAGAASAANIYVNGTGGKDTNDGTSWTSAKQSISSGTSAVSAGGTVYVAKGTYDGDKNRFIHIKKNMTIVGQSQTGTIVNSHESTVFIISSGITATIKGLTLQNGSSLNGGAIINYGNLQVIYTSFKKNTAGDKGGAIINYGSLSVSRSTFTNNKAGNGGAIYNYGKLHAKSSTFTNNKISHDEDSSYSGGAISNTGTLNIADCTFNNNFAPFKGGAIFNTYSLKVTRSTFTGNTANDEGSGGAIYNVGTVTAADTTFASSMSTYGGISNDNTFTAYNCIFKDNKGIAAGAILNGEIGTVTVKNSSFTGNAVDGDGGAIVNYGNMQITGSTFDGNNATSEVFQGRGGAIFNQGRLSITSSNFKNNKAYVGGAIFNLKSITTIHFSRIVGNGARVSGIAIYCQKGSVNAENNWWGSNSSPQSKVNGNVDYSPWIMLRITATPTTVAYQGTSKITTDLTWNTKDGVKPYIQPTGGYIPDGTPVAFGIESGNGKISPKFSATTKGKSYATYTGSSLGTAKIYTQVDMQKKTINVNVNRSR